MTDRKPSLVVLAEAMWQVVYQEKNWDELGTVEQEQVLLEAQHCVEALQAAGYAIIAQATREEFEEAQRVRRGVTDFTSEAQWRAYAELMAIEDELGEE